MGREVNTNFEVPTGLEIVSQVCLNWAFEYVKNQHFGEKQSK